MTLEEVESLIASAPGCQVLTAADGRILAWRDGFSCEIVLSESALRVSVEIGDLGEVYDPASREVRFLPECARKVTELLDAQYLFSETAGFTLSLPRGGGPAKLNLVFYPDGLQADAFLNGFLRLSEVATTWASRLRDGGSGAAARSCAELNGSEVRIEV